MTARPAAKAARAHVVAPALAAAKGVRVALHSATKMATPDGPWTLCICTIVGGRLDGEWLLAAPKGEAPASEAFKRFLAHFLPEAVGAAKGFGGLTLEFDPEPTASITEDEILTWAAANNGGKPCGWAGEKA